MEQALPQVLDQAAFQRVWRRVMPADRPDCPFLLNDAPQPPTVPPAAPVPAAAPVCLGPAGAGQLPGLDRLAAATAEGLQSYRALERRRQGDAVFSRLADGKRRHLSRLSAARFLISGEPSAPAGQGPRSAAAIPLVLRDRFQAEQRLCLDFFTAANAAGDPCLVELYRELGRECQVQAGQIRSWLERHSGRL